MRQSVVVAIVAVLVTCLSVTGATSISSTKGKGTVLWKTKLLDTTYDPGHKVNDYSATGYSATVGTKYLTTDINGTLYALNVSDGAMLWHYNGWPTLPKKIAIQREISGTEKVIVVLRGGVLYGFDSDSGAILYVTTLAPTQAAGAGIFMYAGNLLLSYQTGFQFLDVERNATKIWGEDWAFLTGPIQTQNFANELLVTIAGSSPKSFSLNIFNASAPEGSRKLNTVPLQHLLAGDSFIYAFHVSNTHVMILTEGSSGSSAVKIDISSGSVTFNVKVSTHGIHGYGIGADCFYFHFADSLASYNRSTGEKLADTGAIHNISNTGHLLGYSSYAILGMQTKSGELEVASYNVLTMKKNWALYPPADASLVMLGNWPGTLAVAATDGITLIDANTGGIPFNAATSFKDVNPQSIALGTTHVYFTHSDYAVGVRY